MKKKYILFVFLVFFGMMNAQLKDNPRALSLIDATKTINSEKDVESLYSGTSNTNIPLYVYEDNDFKIPISVEYSSSGYKTYTSIGSIGLGWNLNAGGYIQRKVNGIPDETEIFFYNILQKNPYIRGYSSWDNNVINGSSDETLKKGTVLYNVATTQYYYGVESKYGAPSYVETTPDLFEFNFLGNTGKFMYNKFGTLSVFDTSDPEGEYKIEILNFQDAEFPTNSVKIKITDGNGYKYLFEDKVYFSNAVNYGYTYPNYVTFSTYYPLVEIEAPNGRKVIFEYSETKQTSQIAHYYFSRDADWKSTGDGTRNGFGKGYLSKKSFVPILNSIRIDNVLIGFSYNGENAQGEVVEIKPSAYSDITYSNLYRLGALNQFHILKKNEVGEWVPFKEYKFSYIDPSGVANYKESRNVRLLDKIYLADGVYSMNYYNENQSFPPLTYGRDYWGYWNNSGVVDSFPARKIDNNNVETNLDEKYEPNFNAALKGMLRTVYYPTGGYTRYYYEPHDYSSKLIKDLRNEMQNTSYLEDVNNKIAGGVRIKRITNYTGDGDSTYVDYIYKYKNNPTSSTGILLHTPRFYRYANSDGINAPKQIANISWQNDFTASEDGVHVAYSQVSKRYSNGALSTYNFSDYRTYPDISHNNGTIFQKFLPNGLGSEYADNFFAKNDSRHRMRNKLLSRHDYDSNSKLVYSEEYKYNFKKFNSELSNLEKYEYQPEAEYNIFTVEEAYSYFYIRKHYTRRISLDTIIKTTYPLNSSSNPIIEKAIYSHNKIGQNIKIENNISNGNTLI